MAVYKSSYPVYCRQSVALGTSTIFQLASNETEQHKVDNEVSALASNSLTAIMLRAVGKIALRYILIQTVSLYQRFIYGK